MTKANTVLTGKGNVDIMTKVPASFKAINSPKPNGISLACTAISVIATKGIASEGLTALGHKSNCKGGVIDSTILAGNVHSIEAFISALINSGLSVVKSDIARYGINDTLRAVLAKRVTDHVKWCSNTLNNSHGGFGTRLEKVGLTSARAEIAAHLVELASQLQAQYSSQYSKLYKNR